MRDTKWLLGMAGLLTVTVLLVTAVQAADQRSSAAQTSVARNTSIVEQKSRPTQDDRWRYTFHNGEWWYWLPAARWVYWRNNQWNDYNPRTYTGPVAYEVGYGQTWSGDDRTTTNSNDRPFYGHAESGLDRRTGEPNNEVGPFYGHALPSEVFGPWRRSDRPFYGHAIPTGN
jgi:hypothetical protein